MENKDTLQNIGRSIKSHRTAEEQNYVRVSGIARALCDITSDKLPEQNGRKVFWLVNTENSRMAYQGDGMSIYKNTMMGGILSKYNSGTHKYSQKTRLKKINNVTVNILSRATYTPIHGRSAKEITIKIDGDKNSYRFQRLADLINEHTQLVDRLEVLKKKQEEERQAILKAKKEAEEAARRKAEAEAERLRQEEIKRQEEERRNQEEIERLQAQIEQSEQDIRQTQSFIRGEVSLRLQHILDENQEEAKRSHLFDGTPIVIEGGPGTGKTTTMIQRLKFLISAAALKDYEANLTDKQINELTDVNLRDKNWLFFSPTDKLLGFLRNNMTEEELKANEYNTTILPTFCKKILLDYKLRNPDSDGPFKLYSHKSGEENLIKEANVAIASFEKFLVRKITSILVKISQLQTVDFPWHKLAVEIKSYCNKAEDIKDITALMNLLNTMQTNLKSRIKEQESSLNKEKDNIALSIKRDVMSDELVSKKVYELFEEWEEESVNSMEDNIAEDELDESEDYEDESVNLDFEPKLFKSIKPVLRNLALMKIDSKTKLAKRQVELYDLIKEYVDKQDLSKIAHLEWFKKNFAFPCRGIESNIFNQIPKIYKEYRKEQIKLGSLTFNQPLLQKIQKKDGGKQIHREELELLVGFINNMIYGIYKKSKVRFEAMKNNKYVKAYMDSTKPVIGIDEATDYSYIDYYFMTSFRHYEYSSITLCGDLMQGLNSNGVKDWKDLERLLPKLKVYELKESYRQVPTLLDMSKKLYKDERGKDAPYSTTKERSDSEPAPLCYISDDMEEKARWMCKRIIDIYKYYNETMPAVAILVGDNVNINELQETMEDLDLLNGIEIHDCSENRTTNSTKCVRIFRLSEVKGMEFEVVFFYDIDTALAGQSHDMMRRYLYVGVSRATSHLAATFTEEEGNEDIIQYFDTKKKNWRL